MPYAAIMVYVEADATPEHRVRLAATLAGAVRLSFRPGGQDAAVAAPRDDRKSSRCDTRYGGLQNINQL